jgi:hypothetical protein
MRDDKTMEDAIVVVAEQLFGDAVDPRELSDFISKMNDQSEMHVNQDLSGSAKKAHKRKQVVNAVGQGLNALAIGAGGHALLMAGRDERLANSKNPVARTLAAPYKKWAGTRAGKAIGPKSNFGRKYAIPLATGAIALHSAELVGDSIAARALRDQRKQNNAGALKTVSDAAVQNSTTKKDAVQDIAVKKALDQIVDARRRGIITTDTAISMSSDLVSKVSSAMNLDAKSIHEEAKALVPMATDGPKKMGLKPLAKTKPVGTKPMKGTVPAVPNRVPESSAEKNNFSKADSPDLTWEGTIEKTDTDKRQVFGYCTVTHVNGEAVVDRQGDYVPLDEIEKAAYTYVVNSRKGGDMHTRAGRNGEIPLQTSDMVESFVVTPEKLLTMGLDENAIPHGWWVGFKVNDDKQWEMVKSGERTAFSIHGQGKRSERVLED